MKRKISSLLLFSFLFILLGPLYAGGKQEAASPAPAATGDPWRRYAGTEIVFTTYVGGEASYLETIIPEFEAKTGIKVILEQLPFDQLQQKIQLDGGSRSGSMDLFDVDMMRLPEYAGAGYLANLTTFLNNPNLTDRSWYKPEDFLEAPMNAGKYNNIQYGIPFTAEASILYYRKDLFQKHNIKVPTNYAELMAACKALKDGGESIAPIGLRGLRGNGMNIYTWAQYFRGSGASFFKNFPSDMTPTVNSPQGIAGTKVYVDLLRQYGPPGVANWTNMDIYTGMASGAIAMAIDTNAYGGTIEDKASSKTAGNWGYAVSPAGPAGIWPAFFSHILGINAHSKNLEGAWLFAQWITSPEIVALRGMKRCVPSRVSAWNDPAFQKNWEYIGAGNYTKIGLEAIKSANAGIRPAFPNWAQMGDILGIAVQDAIAGGTTVEAAMNKAQADITAMLKNNGYIK
ncbi:MAG: sugar ABC transporter substrate-binding protein [Treponema sp.]|nr:sugar ABC transporter substrate-binding protein [Treponema sp.]